MKRCPFCAEEIQDAAVVCRFCNRDVRPDSVRHPPASNKVHPAVVAVTGVLVLIVVGILIDAATDDGKPTAYVPQTVAAPAVQPAPAPIASPAATAPRSNQANELQHYLEENFSETSWYPHITGVKVMFGAAWIETDIYPDGDAHGPAARICGAVSSYVYSSENTVGLTGVRVGASTGERLAMRTSISEPC